MKTIAAFKKRAVIGATVDAILYHLWQGAYHERKRFGIRRISQVQTRGFALWTWHTSKQEYTDSWCLWPTKEQFVPVNDNTIEIHFEGGKLVYTFC